MNSSWQTLPTEMQLAVVDSIIDKNDLRSLSRVSQSTYSVCLPALFRDVELKNLSSIFHFLETVPREYCRWIQQLEINTQSDCGRPADPATTEAVIALLVASPCIGQLALHVAGSLGAGVIHCFPHLSALRHLTIANVSEEHVMPLSERLVVSIAASVPNLQHLSLDRVSRSLIHAQELVGAYPYIPLVTTDSDIPTHPLLGSDLSLPSLLRIPTLRKLIIRDTHLGDPKWATTPVACQLQVLDLGSCCHESEELNRTCTERIMTAVGKTVDEFSLTTSLSDAICAAPLQRLRTLHISPFFPVDAVVDTFSTLSQSPIENLSMQCYEEDVEDVCSALEDFLSLRREKGPTFYDKLSKIDLTIAASSSSSYTGKATKRLETLCRDLKVASRFRTERTPLDVCGSENLRSLNLFADIDKWSPAHSVDHGRVRAMTV